MFTLATNIVSNTYNVLVMLVVRIFTNIDIVSNTYYKLNLVYLIRLYRLHLYLSMCVRLSL